MDTNEVPVREKLPIVEKYRAKVQCFFNQRIFMQGEVTDYIPGIEDYQGRSGHWFEPVNVVMANVVTAAGGTLIAPDKPKLPQIKPIEGSIGWYELSNGEKIKGKDKAQAAQDKLNGSVSGKPLPTL